MRKLTVIEHVSLDGVLQHTADDTDFPYIGWTTKYRTPAGLELVLARYGDTFDLVLGRRTYDLWSESWGSAPSSPMADRIAAATKHIATHRPESLAWGPARHLGADPVEGVRAAKDADGPDLVVPGSSSLTSALLGSGLVDVLVLITYPVLLGTGTRFLAEGTPARELTPVDTATSPTGVTITSYAVGGAVPRA